MDLITMLIGALATARLTRLVTTDRITLAPRIRIINALIGRGREDGLLMYLITCDWCVSMYMGTAVTLGIWAAGDPAVWICAALTFSYVAGFLAAREGE